MSTNFLDINKQKAYFIIFSGIYLFFITLMLTPFVNAYMFSYFQVSTKVFLIISSAVLGLFQLFFYVPKIKKTKIPKIIIAIIKILIISTLFSVLLAPMPASAIFGMYGSWESNIIIFIAYSILAFSWLVHFFIMRELGISKLFFELLMTLLIVTISVIGIFSYHILDINNNYISSGIQRLSLNFKNPLIAAFFIGMLVNYQFTKTALHFGRKDSKMYTSIAHLALNTAISYTLLLTYTRSSWIASIAALIISTILIFTLLTKNKVSNISIKRVTIGILLAIISLLPFIYIRNAEISKRNTDIMMESQKNLTALAKMLGEDDKTKALDFYQNVSEYTSADIRLMEWEWGIKTFLGTPKNFLLGTGPDNLYFEMPKYRDPEFNNLPTDSSMKPFYIRNMYINFLAERGVVTSLLTITLVIIIGIKILKNINLRLDLLIPISVLISFFAQGVFYYPSHITTVLFVFTLSYLVSELVKKSNIKLRIPNKSEILIMSLLAISLIGYLFIFYKGEKTLAHIQARLLTPNPPTQQELEKAANIPLQNHILKRYLIYVYPRAESSQNYIDKYMDSKDPQDLSLIADRLMYIAREDNDAKALDNSIITINRLVLIDPTFPVYWDERGLKYLLKRDFISARESFNKAIELKPDYWTAYLHMGELSRQECNPKEAIEWYEQAKEYIRAATTEITEAESEIENPRPECVEESSSR